MVRLETPPIKLSVMHPEFQKWGSVANDSQKVGPTLQNVGWMTFVSTHLNLGLTKP